MDLSGDAGPVAQGDGGLGRTDLDLIEAWMQNTSPEPWPPPGAPAFGRDVASGPWPSPGGARDPFGPFSTPSPTMSPATTLGDDVCPSCHQTREELLAARRVQQERRERAQRVRERHQRWEGSHQETHGEFLQGPQTTLAQDVEATRSQLVTQRVALLQAAARHSAPDPFAAFLRPKIDLSGGMAGYRPVIPAELATAWTAAYQEKVVVAALVREDLLTLEAAALSRARYLDFYRLLVPIAEQSDRWHAEAERQSRETALALRPRPGPCPGCHSPTPAPLRHYRAPAPQAPSVHRWHAAVADARSNQEWTTATAQFDRATTMMDALALATVPIGDDATQSFTAARDLLARQEDLLRRHPEAIRVRTVFYPQDKWLQPNPPDGPTVEIAHGIPWFFYLTATSTPTQEGYPDWVTWTLRDVTSPGRPEVSHSTSIFDYFNKEEQRIERPPRELFEKLNDKLVFPEGVLYWRYPDGRSDELRTTEPWSLSDWLGAIGIGLTALGLILVTGGLATPAVLTGLGVAAAGFGVASTLADLHHRSELGILTEADTQRAILFLAADIVSALTLGLGRAATLAGEAAVAAGRTTRIAVRLRQAASVANLADRTLGATVMVTMASDYVGQYRAIMASGLPPAERDAALSELTRSALFTGAIVLGPHAVSGVAGRLRGGGAHAPSGGGGHTDPALHGTGEPHAAGIHHPHPEAGFLHESAQREVLPASDAARELQVAEQVGQSRQTPGDPEYRRSIDIEGHTWKERRGGTGWCRFSSKRCYTPGELAVGVRGRGERTTAATVEDVARRRLELGRRPSTMRSDAARLDWADYVFYAERRLRAIEEALAAGATPKPPPRTFASFREAHPLGSVVRNAIRGDKFEGRTRAAIVEELGAERAELVLNQPNISEVLNPTRAEGMLTRPDSLMPDMDGTWTGWSNKSRESLAGMSGTAVRTQVLRDLEEAVEKYAGIRQVRRTGEEVNVTRIWLLYDADAVPQSVRPTVRRTVAEYQRLYEPADLAFEVGIF